MSTAPNPEPIVLPTRRLDPVWGSDAVAKQADADTFCFTNACPQHKDLNQKEWLKLEDYVLDNSDAHDLKVCVLTGPVFAADAGRLPHGFGSCRHRLSE